MPQYNIPFTQPYLAGNELIYIEDALQQTTLVNAKYTQLVKEKLRVLTTCSAVMPTNSCTHALEMAALLINIQPGDEIIMPSFTFSSTANAFVMRGGVPVFVDIRSDTLNIDEDKIEAAITPKTKAIVPVHYAGISCNMSRILEIANQHNLYIIEDAAQGLFSTYNKKPLGSFGHLACVSFHYTKNITCGSGGALLINDTKLIERAKIIWEKGTNREAFFEGVIDKYTWIDLGSSYAPSELSMAMLLAQLELVEPITQQRKKIWQTYHDAFHELDRSNLIKKPYIPGNCEHNGHLYYLLFDNKMQRDSILQQLCLLGIEATFHFIPLHISPAGQKFCRAHGALKNTEELSERLLRLPLWNGIEHRLPAIIQEIKHSIQRQSPISNNLRN